MSVDDTLFAPLTTYSVGDVVSYRGRRMTITEITTDRTGYLCVDDGVERVYTASQLSSGIYEDYD